MRRVIFICAVLMITIWLSACGLEAGNAGKGTAAEPPVKILATIFPEYDWVREILGERSSYVQLELLVDSGVDLHSYQPTVKDIMDIASCDLFIYVGGESDMWVEETLEQTKHSGREVISLMETLGDSAKEEEIIEGMEAHGEENEDAEYDEHVWLSVKNARIFCEAIAGKLADIDPGHGEIYRENARVYGEKLSHLDGQYQEMADMAEQKVLLFGDRFPFRYLVDDYGLFYYAAFAGCSAESEVSFRTVAYLASQADTWNLSSIVMMKGGDGKLAETIRRNTRLGNQRILVMDSMQAITAQEIESGVSYLSIMEQNLEALKMALETG